MTPLFSAEAQGWESTGWGERQQRDAGNGRRKPSGEQCPELHIGSYFLELFPEDLHLSCAYTSDWKELCFEARESIGCTFILNIRRSLIEVAGWFFSSLLSASINEIYDTCFWKSFESEIAEFDRYMYDEEKVFCTTLCHRKLYARINYNVLVFANFCRAAS